MMMGHDGHWASLIGVTIVGAVLLVSVATGTTVLKPMLPSISSPTQGLSSHYTLRDSAKMPGTGTTDGIRSGTDPVPTLVATSGSIGFPPHPFPILYGSPASFSGHYYAGSDYSGSATTATQLEVTVGVPDDFPQSDFYYVILSVWDNAGSYDQVGFSNDYGTWGVAYSTSTYCAGTYYYSPDAFTLTQGQNYVFDMTISSGTVYFTAINSATANIVWSYSTYTGGTNFVEQGTYSCNGNSYYDYTDYEEVYSTTGPVVPYDLFFTYNSAGGYLVTTWNSFTSSAPSGVTALISSYDTTIENEPYYAYFTSGSDSTTVEPTTSPTTYYWSVSIADLSPDSPITVLGYYSPNGWTVNFVPAQGNPPYTTQLSFSLPSSTSPGSYYLGVVAFDGTGTYNRIALTVDVISGVSASPFGSPASGGIDLGQSTTLYAGASGGSGSYTYSWISLPAGCAASPSASISCAPSASGTFALTVTVTDSLGYSVTASATYAVDTDPTVSAPSVTPSSSDEGQIVVFSASAAAGAGGYAYQWTGLPSGCLSSSASFSCKPSTSGTFTVTVRVTDANAYAVTSNPVSFTVYNDPSVSPVTVSRGSADVGQSVTFSSSASGGSGGLTYAWSGLPTGCSSSGTTTDYCRATGAGTFAVTFTVTDSNGGTANSTLSYTVYDDPALTPPASSPTAIDVGQSATFSVSAVGGSGAYSFLWNGLPSGCQSANKSSLSCRPSAAGTYTISVSVIDSNGFHSANVSFSFQVFTDPTITSFSASPSSLLQGSSMDVSVEASGGSSPLNYTYVGLPSGCSATNASSFSCTPSSTGTFVIAVSVTDANGFKVSANTTLTVNPSFLGLPAVEGYAVVGGIVAAVVIAVSLLVLARRKRRHEDTQSTAPGAAVPPPPGAPPGG